MPSAHSMTTREILPSAVTHTLDSAGITFSLHASHSVDAQLRAHAIVLQHLNQQYLVVIPRHHILDLAKLNARTGGHWQALINSTQSPWLSRYSLEALPAIPTLFNIPCLYASELLSNSMTYIESGVADLLIGLSPCALRTLFATAEAIECSQIVALQHPNHSPAAADAQGIEQAVIALTKRRIHKRLEETLEIPLLSSTAKKVLRLRTDPLADIDELAAIVETDPPLAAQVISWAASPYYAAPGKIRSVEDAITRVLGFDLVINLALGLSLGKNLALPTDKPQYCTPYWQQAIYTAALIEGLVRLMPAGKKPESGLAYLAGLLHNFGFALLAHVFPPHFSLVCRSIEANSHLSHSVVEYHLLGITREQMGAWLMQCWNIPDELVYALRYQDDPMYQEQHATYANLTCLALLLLAQNNIGRIANNTIPDALYERLGLSPDKAQLALQRVLEAEQALRNLVAQFNQS